MTLCACQNWMNLVYCWGWYKRSYKTFERVELGPWVGATQYEFRIGFQTCDE
jgi:hypothetical protein